MSRFFCVLAVATAALLCGATVTADATADTSMLEGLPSTYRAYAEYAEAQHAAGHLDAAQTLFRQLAARASTFVRAPAAVAHIHTRLAACTAATGHAADVPAIFRACVTALTAAPPGAAPLSARRRALFVCHAQWCAALLANSRPGAVDAATAENETTYACSEAERLSREIGDDTEGTRDAQALRAEGLLLRGEWLLARGNATGALAAIDEARADLDPVVAERALLRTLAVVAEEAEDEDEGGTMHTTACGRIAEMTEAVASRTDVATDTLALAALAKTRCGGDSEAVVARAMKAVAAETRALGCAGFRVVLPPTKSRHITAFPFYEFSDIALVHPSGIFAHLEPEEQDDEEDDDDEGDEGKDKRKMCTAYVTQPPRLEEIKARTARPAVQREALFPAREIGGARAQVTVENPVLLVPPTHAGPVSDADAVLDVLPRAHHVQQRFPRRRVAVLADPAHPALAPMLRALGHREADGTLVPHYAPDVLRCCRVHVAGPWASPAHHARAVRAFADHVRATLGGVSGDESKSSNTAEPRVVFLSRRMLSDTEGDNNRETGEMSAVEEERVCATVREMVGAAHVEVVHPAQLEPAALVRAVAHSSVVLGTPGPALAAALWAPAHATLIVLPTRSAPNASEPTADALHQLAGTHVAYVERTSHPPASCPSCVVSLESLRTQLTAALPGFSLSPPQKDEL